MKNSNNIDFLIGKKEAYGVVINVVDCYCFDNMLKDLIITTIKQLIEFNDLQINKVLEDMKKESDDWDKGNTF